MTQQPPTQEHPSRSLGPRPTITSLAITSLAITLLALILWGLASIETPSVTPGGPTAEGIDGIDRLVASITSLDVLAEMARLTAIALCGYLLVAVLALAVTGFMAKRMESRNARGYRATSFIQAVLRRATPRFVLTVVASSLISTGVASASQPSATVGSIGATTAKDRALSDPPTMELVTPGSEARTEMPWGHPPEDTPDVDAPAVGESQAAMAPAATTHRVAPGEHLWSIAEDLVRSRSGDGAHLKEVTDYWSDLISLNRDRLADPGNPDLILPGQELRLPA